jgi:hypothetical protein
MQVFWRLKKVFLPKPATPVLIELHSWACCGAQVNTGVAPTISFHQTVLISGDALVTLNLLTGEHVSPGVPYRLLNYNDAQARRSVARLRELGRVTMLPGHGRPWQGTIAEAVSGVGMFVTSPALLENSE